MIAQADNGDGGTWESEPDDQSNRVFKLEMYVNYERENPIDPYNFP